MASKEELEKTARQSAIDQYHRDGSIEIDENAKVSLSYDDDEASGVVQGAYVQAWVWVDFPKGTKEG